MDLPIVDENSEFLVEMAEICRRKLGKTYYRLCVFSDEGPLPHFHLHPANGVDKDKDVCIRLDVPEYFDHNPKYKKRLNAKEKKQLIGYLKEEDEGITLWDLMRRDWNQLYPNYRVAPVMPDYSKLPKVND